MLLFLTTNMAAVTSRANQQYSEKFMDVRRIRFQKTLSSQSYMVDILMFSLNISAKPTFILRKSKGNSYSQTCMIFSTG